MIQINTEVLEMFIYYWQATAEKEKVSDLYLWELATRAEMAPLFGKGFGKDSVRKVLSSITNREILSEKTKEEGRFWNNNMWMLEDLDLTMAMLATVKKLSGSEFADFGLGDFTINFIPGHLEPYYLEKDQLFINFFKLSLNLETGDVGVDGMELKAFINQILKSRGQE